MTDHPDHRGEADRIVRETHYSIPVTEHLLAAIHDEQQAQTDVLTDLLEALRPKGDPCGCRRDVEPKSVTVTLPRDVVESHPAKGWRLISRKMRPNRPLTADLIGALADALDAATTPPASPGARESDDQPQEAPEGAEAATGRTGTNLGRIGWFQVSETGPRCLAREVEHGWSDDETGFPRWRPDDFPEATFTPLTPAAFGWTVVGEGQVAVEQYDLDLALGYIPATTAEGSNACRRLRAALDGSGS